jgi:hypothetical protein
MAALPPDPSQYCSLLSAQAGESLPGTASRAKTWLLLEYRGIWGSKAFEESSLPQPVKDHLSQALKTLPGAKLQLISHHARSSHTGIAFFLGQSGDREPRLYEFHPGSYEALLDLDFAAILAGAQPAILRERPLILVCTNGRRDACCARWGMPTYNAICEAADTVSIRSDAVWQSTHMGGHRLAPNVLNFPAGIQYGRVQPDDAQNLVEHIVRGEIFLKNLRGRSCYLPVVQAAEYYLHQQTRRLAEDAFVLSDATETSSGEWQVRFQDAQSGDLHQVRLSVRVTSTPIRQSCGKEKAEPLVEFTLAEARSV